MCYHQYRLCSSSILDLSIDSCFFFKQKTAYEMRISDWSSDVCSSDLPVWTYHTGPSPAGSPASFQATPLKIGERLYFCTGYNDVISLDAETGKEIWRHRPQVDPAGIYGLTCRGVTYYRVPDAKGLCAERIYTATVDARLIALDAVTGARCPGFGRNGRRREIGRAHV